MGNNGTVVLMAYTIRLREKNDTKKLLDLSNFGGKNEDLYEIIKTYLESQKPKAGMNPKIYKEGNKKTLFFNTVDYDDKKREIRSRVDIGEYGLSYPLIDVDTGATKYTAERNDTTALPINFYINIPNSLTQKGIKRTHGIIVFEKFRNRGAKGLFHENFDKYFKMDHEDLKVEIESYTPDYILEYLRNNLDGKALTKVELKSLVIPKDLTDVYSGKGLEKKAATIKVELSGAGFSESFLSGIQSRLRHEAPVTGIVGEWLTPEQISFNVEVDGERKRIIIKEEGETVLPGIDITSKVEDDKNTGFPLQSDVYREAEKHAKQILERMDR